MEKNGLVLHETFRSQMEERRKERFQKEFEQYIMDLVEKSSSENSWE